ncbi:hypothetical protein [Breoghania sp. JC706]|uniref:cyclophilin-like fold protein n=1 Tax=Breoghania sp. JC706 TaxID=3117732 RepID=UPI003008896E
MRLAMEVEGKEICKIEVFEDKCPIIAKELREKLPLKTMLQHGKLNGDLIFFTLPIVAPWENKYITGDLGKERIKEKGTAAGTVCFYGPRQQFCIVYGDDTSDEPLPISYIGEVVEGEMQLRVTGMETWFDQGRVLELKVID